MALERLEAEFIGGATHGSHYPTTGRPEVAFLGRSNVGKSSLLNYLVHRKNLALVSGNPGKTRQINFFDVDGKWVFVDVPGFGYAKVSKEMRSEWEELIRAYVQQREDLRCVFYLLDSRRDPGDIDLAYMEWFENSQCRFATVLTKVDKISEAALRERKEQLKELLQFCQYHVDTVATSAQARIGRDTLLGMIKRLSSKR